ncbi:2,4'-dihydroxyacetophenone dioxygenase family protein [Verrucosispora sp. WMMD1129]|uniref:2,4'-dihydroxyacetophenone dioxygenase family protein n=1 Tax=Verrucosispora sp. WMMD1129 TaxID=3016093 RepID=UPI002499CC5C|nr:2,4'-dihydroxyacetophenone dioxygenase family protein [Verrucosispora sp. WMMD1129]WFE43509.1 2,4'-dihydroxyacetophenone dioxygenase family protein [Verrucosispora sp. WMMD1129]
MEDPATGGSFMLLHVDRLSGLWVVRSRFAAGTVVPQHLHSGSVSAVTLAGQWGYPELDVRCGVGDYLVEEAGTVHSLAVHGTEPADVIFSILGSITYFHPDGTVDRIEDWRSVLDDYEAGCAEQRRRPKVIGSSLD